jgi:hypothetical protein
MAAYEHIPLLKSLLQSADYHDVKIVESDVTLREFIAGFIGYYPAWVKFLYRVRQEGIPKDARLSPEQIPMTAGEKLSFFKVDAAEENSYWIASAADTHLMATLAIVAEPGANGHTRYSGITIVKYRRWTGPVYFNVIRPFHHLVVNGMMQSGAKGVA